MRLPLHAIRVWSETPRPSSPIAVLQQAIEGPLIRLEETTDVIGIPVGFDVVIQDGAYVFVFAMLVWSFLRRRVDKDSAEE